MLFGKKIQKEIKVDGMHCMHCAGKVEAAIKALDGVKSVKADPNTKSVVITSSVELDNALIAQAVKSAGFTMVE
ncbi:MAG: heavy-metal-associated domain-containing protein [Clostridiales bacterium]|nr:heavy-metal-associated domain-containing protein [Clostridiales bacterium]